MHLLSQPKEVRHIISSLCYSLIPIRIDADKLNRPTGQFQDESKLFSCRFTVKGSDKYHEVQLVNAQIKDTFTVLIIASFPWNHLKASTPRLQKENQYAMESVPVAFLNCGVELYRIAATYLPRVYLCSFSPPTTT